MARFILRYSSGDATVEHAAKTAAESNVKVVDQSPKMLLLESSEGEAKELAEKLPGWTLHPEIQYQIPDARKRIR